MEEIKLASIQFEIKQGDKEANISKAGEFIKKAAEEKANLICFSEYFSTGFDSIKLKELAEPIPGPTTKIIGEKAKEYNVFVSAPIAERKADKLYSTLALIGPNGKVIGQHRKVQPWVLPPREEEVKILTSGEDFEPIRGDGLAIGSLVDADMDFPEAARILALKGAEIILNPLHAESMYNDVIRLAPIVRAVDNLSYILTTNRVGRWAGYNYTGCSMIVSPLGEILAYIGDREGVITATLDLKDLRNWRKEAWSPFKRFNKKSYTYLSRFLKEKGPE